MVQDAIDKLKELKLELNNLNRSFTTTKEVKIDISKIKKELTEELKRELQGRTSYGLGI